MDAQTCPAPTPEPSRRDELRALSRRLLLRRQAVPLILQSEAAECGLACLAMVAAYHGHRIDIASLRRRFPPSSRGVNLRSLAATASALELSGRALRLEVADVGSLRTPCILHWDLTHFVVLVRVSRGRATILDPAVGRRVCGLEELSGHFTGVALELTPTREFRPLQEERCARITDLWSSLRGFPASIGAIFGLSALLQLCGLAAPFFTQIVMDQVLVRRDLPLLGVLVAGFGLLLALRVALAYVRDHTTLWVSQLLSFQLGTNLLRHLVRLPLAYFEKRHVGDVLSRVGSLEPIRELLSTGFVTAVLDGIMTLFVLVMMLLYSPALALLSVGVATVFALLRVALYQPLRQLSEEAIVAGSRESTHLIELVRGISAVKLLGIESDREAEWQNRRAQSMNAGVRRRRWEMGFSAASSLLFGAENLISVALAARLVLEQEMTIGMLYAFISYRSQFSDRIGDLIDWALRYRLLDVHLRRLADVIHTPEEPGLRETGEVSEPLAGQIELRGVGFRYSESDPWVLRDVNMRIPAGSCAALVGRSGGGKTTLLKILLGLLEPSEGEILVDGQRLGAEGLRAYRQQIGTVMQDDHFFEGTIADNISAFDAEGNAARVQAAAREAFVHDDISALPMSYRSWIGNMGGNLSGGQRQRILLARAFYRNPRLLVLDEGTANLDPALVDAVWGSLERRRVTRVIATHQHSVLARVDHIFRVQAGSVELADPEQLVREAAARVLESLGPERGGEPERWQRAEQLIEQLMQLGLQVEVRPAA